MTTRIRTLATIVLAAIGALGLAAAAQAANTNAWSYVYYSESTGRIYGCAGTDPDYDTAYYYEASTFAWLLANGQPVSSGWGDDIGGGWVQWYSSSNPLAEPGVTYTVEGDHYLEVYYNYYYYDPWCTWDCWDWYDGYGYDLIAPMISTGSVSLSAPGWWIIISNSVIWAALTADSMQSPPPTLNCNPSPVTRGGSVNCSVTGAGAATASWSFSGGGGSVTGPSGTASWGGTMVTGGTVTANIPGYGSLQQSIEVDDRSGWELDPVSPQQVPNGTFITLPTPPYNASGVLGRGNLLLNFVTPGLTPVSGGPNSGYAFFASNVSLNDSFRYQINPDLENSGSEFSQHQFGACGFISWSNLLDNVTDHESGSAPTKSHYAQYVSSLGENDPGPYVEARVANPQANMTEFQNLTHSEVQSRLNRVKIDTVDDSGLYSPDTDHTTGQWQGYVNFAPYQECN